MELRDAIRRRAMVRSFSADPIDPALVDRLLWRRPALPYGGQHGGTAWVVLQGPDQTAVYFDATTDETGGRYHDWTDGLARAPVVLLAYTSPDAYVSRYAEADKAGGGLGEGADRWPVPYWFGDAAFGVMAVLLGAVDVGLGACILGAFRGEAELAVRFDVPPGGACSAPSCSAIRDGATTGPPRSTARSPGADRVHRGRWTAEPATATNLL